MAGLSARRSVEVIALYVVEHGLVIGVRASLVIGVRARISCGLRGAKKLSALLKLAFDDEFKRPAGRGR